MFWQPSQERRECARRHRSERNVTDKFRVLVDSFQPWNYPSVLAEVEVDGAVKDGREFGLDCVAEDKEICGKPDGNVQGGYDVSVDDESYGFARRAACI